jgi:hypothetical protein
MEYQVKWNGEVDSSCVLTGQGRRGFQNQEGWLHEWVHFTEEMAFGKTPNVSRELKGRNREISAYPISSYSSFSWRSLVCVKSSREPEDESS